MTTHHKGFTLIEAVIYLALFSILIGGAVVAAYSLFDAATRSGTRTMLKEENDFFLSKIDWALSGAEAVTVPAAGSAGVTLTVAKWDSADPAVITFSGGDLYLDGTRLNNTNVEVTNARFSHVADPGAGTSPEYVEAVVTSSALTPLGSVVSTTGTTTVYLRR